MGVRKWCSRYANGEIITRVKKYEGKIICRSAADMWTDGVLDDYKRLVGG